MGVPALLDKSVPANACVIPQLSRFTELHPELEFMLKPVEQMKDFDARVVDVAVMTGRRPDGEFIVRWLVQTRNMICASPDYWQRRDKPTAPEDLRRHDCLVMRSSGGAPLDRWIFAREDDERDRCATPDSERAGELGRRCRVG